MTVIVIVSKKEISEVKVFENDKNVIDILFIEQTEIIRNINMN